jgi:flagellin
MSRINTNVSSMLSQRIFNQNNDALSQSLERLSTGYRINRGGDDPAGLIASENMRSQKTAISAAIGNAERADQVVNIAEGGLQEINGLLLEVQSLVGQSANEAGLSEEEKEANQLQIDSILQTIDRIAESTTFQGSKLLNGSFDFQLKDQNAAINDVQVNTAKLPGDEQKVNVLVTQSAQNAGLALNMSTATALDLSGTGTTFVFEVAGAAGARQFSFASGTTFTDIATQVNTFTEVTGVSAAASGGVVRMYSTEMGDDNYVSVDIKAHDGQQGVIESFGTTDQNALMGSGTTAFNAANGAIRDAGQDVGAIINGVAATSDGSRAKISNEFLDVELDLVASGAQNLASIEAFTITGGGATFNLGPNVDISNRVSLGIKNVASRNLGDVNTGFLASLGSGQANNVVDGDKTAAQKVVNESIKEVSSLRGRLGAFQKNTIGATIRSLGVALENTAAAESAIRDTDFATETAELTRRQILVQAASNTLSLANSAPQSVLSLL